MKISISMFFRYILCEKVSRTNLQIPKQLFSKAPHNFCSGLLIRAYRNNHLCYLALLVNMVYIYICINIYIYIYKYIYMQICMIYVYIHICEI